MTVQDYFDLYRVQTPGCIGIWDNKLKFVVNKDEADFYVGLDHIPDPALFDPDRTIVLGREPKSVSWLYCDLSQARVKYPLHYDLGNCYHTARWWVQRTYDYLMGCGLSMCLKSGNLGAVLSFHLNRFPGHAHRVEIARRLLKDFDFDLYGKLCKTIFPVDNPMGRLMGAVNDKFDALSSYKYAFCSDNSSYPGFFGDTLVDAYLSWCLPIYWGCPNLGDYFPEDSFVNITGMSIDDAIMLIRETVERPPTLTQLDAIRHARDLVLNKYNLWPTLLEVIETGKVTWGPDLNPKIPHRPDKCFLFHSNLRWYT